MASTNTPATNETTLYGQFSTYLITQRASSVQASTRFSAALSSGYNSTELDLLRATMYEVCQTLAALGYWKGSS